MLTKSLNLLLSILGLYIIGFALQDWYVKWIDTSTFSPFRLPYIWIFKGLIYGTCLLLVSSIPFKTTDSRIGFVVAVFSFPVFSELEYFAYEPGLIFWIMGMILLLSNVATFYKILVILIYCLWLGVFAGRSFYPVILSLIVLIAIIIVELGSMSNALKHKMSTKNKSYFAILFLPMVISEISLLLGFPSF